MGARTVSFLEETAQEIADAGGDVIWQRTDITNADDCRALAQAAVDKWGGIDALLNNAALTLPFGLFEDADLADWRKNHEVNIYGSLQMAQACIPAMKKRGKAYIVNVSSMAHKKPLPQQGAYASAKAGLEGATRHLALELGQYGIRVNTARMGWMDGPPVDNYLGAVAQQMGVSEDEVRRPIIAGIPIGLIPDDADCANAVLFLCTPWADAVSGAVLDINGGEFMS